MNRRALLPNALGMTHRLELSGLIVLAALSGCSDSSPSESEGAGGSSAKGGTVSASGGAGAASNGGTSALGGGNSLGGASAGGVSSGGANAASGGALTAGGGGGVSSGGVAAGGATGTSNGGMSASGGAKATGGVSSGGTTSVGGTGVGGSKATGGVSSGGNVGTGGASGGTANSGGTTSSGGASNTGGATGTGGGSVVGVVGQPIGFATQNGGTTGGKGGQVVTVKTFAELKQYAGASQPYIILVSGTISNGAGGGKVNITSNKSLVGIGSTAFLQGVGLEVASSNNVIIQNLKVTLVGTTTPASVNGGDAIVINGTSKNVWIDHCELYSEDPTVQTNIDKYDGLIDIRDQTGFITVSWSYLHDHHKTCLVGASDTDIYADRKITYHHNYFKKIVKRAPEYRGAVGHFFNNYVVGTGATEASFLLVDTCLRIEKNVYENVNFAIYTVASGTKGNAERIDNIASQSRAWPPACTANIPYDYKSALTATTSDVKTVVPAGAGVGKI